MLSKRVASAVVLIPIVAIAVYYGGLWLFALLLVAGLLAGYEYVKMVRLQGSSTSWVLTLLLIFFFLADAQWPQLNLLRWGLLSVSLVALAVQVFHDNVPGSLASWALTVAGGIYIGFSLSYFIRLCAIEQGMYWLILALLGTWICDSGAYFVGRSFGKRKLAPKISPKKTWEGAIGGFVTGILAVVLLGYFMLDVSMGYGFILGVFVVAAATLGDLAESVIKRQVGVKDSGALIPGHGGMLDRIDSLLFVVPTVYCGAVILSRLG